MMHPSALHTHAASPRLTLLGIKAVKILQQWNQLNLMHCQRSQGLGQAFHQMLHDISEFSAPLQQDNDSAQVQDYSTQLIELLLDATFGKYDVAQLNAFIKNHWKPQAAGLTPEIAPYFYVFQLEPNRRNNDRRTAQGCRRHNARASDRRDVERRKFISF